MYKKNIEIQKALCTFLISLFLIPSKVLELF